MRPLPREARQVLLALELISHGSTQAWNTSGGARGEKDQALPPGESRPPHLFWAARFYGSTLDALPALVDEARAELLSIRRRDQSGVVIKEETRTEWEQRIISQGEGFEAREVANKFRCGVTDVTAIRRKYKRDPNTGKARITELRGEGKTVRQIAELTGVPKSVVGRMVKDRAA